MCLICIPIMIGVALAGKKGEEKEEHFPLPSELVNPQTGEVQDDTYDAGCLERPSRDWVFLLAETDQPH